MKIYRKALILMLTAGIAFCAALCGCSQSSSSSKADDDKSVSDNTNDEAYQAAKAGGLKALGVDPEALGIKPEIKKVEGKTVGYQLELPKDGEEVAVVETSLGSFKLRLFPEAAPKTVENFKKLAKEGKYDGTIFHRVVKDFVVQGGHIGSDEKQPNGQSSYGQPFEDEFCDALFNIRGAVAMSNSGKDTNGTQFFVNQMNAQKFQENGGWSFYDDVWKECCEQIRQYKDNAQMLSAYIDENGDRMINTEIVPKDVKSLYVQNGGNPNLDGAYNAADRGSTVFAQVYEGMETVDKIAAVKVDDKEVPKDNVVIKSIKLTTYSAPEETKEAATEAAQ